jgi:hypothetical protein
MINETVHRVQKEMKLVLAERSRDEHTLTNDLWRKAVSFEVEKKNSLIRSVSIIKLFFIDYERGIHN